MWHKFNPWGDSLSHTISRSKVKGHIGHSNFCCRRVRWGGGILEDHWSKISSWSQKYLVPLNLYFNWRILSDMCPWSSCCGWFTSWTIVHDFHLILIQLRFHLGIRFQILSSLYSKCILQILCCNYSSNALLVRFQATKLKVSQLVYSFDFYMIKFVAQCHRTDE